MLARELLLPSCNHSSPVADGLLSTDTRASIHCLQLYSCDTPGQGSQDPLSPTDPSNNGFFFSCFFFFFPSYLSSPGREGLAVADALERCRTATPCTAYSNMQLQGKKGGWEREM